MATENKLLTTKETAEFLRCNPVSVWRYRKSGRLNFLKSGGKILFEQSAIDEFLKVESSHRNTSKHSY